MKRCDLEAIFHEQDCAVATLMHVLSRLLDNPKFLASLPNDDLLVAIWALTDAEAQIKLALALVDSPAPGTH
jgi:hypothetical protein